MEHKLEQLKHVSNIKEVNRLSKLIYDTKVLPSTRKDKKYMIHDGDKWVHFGSIHHQDYTYHGDENRRMNYLRRARNIGGKWKDNPYSPNNLAIHLLWNYH